MCEWQSWNDMFFFFYVFIRPVLELKFVKPTLCKADNIGPGINEQRHDTQKSVCGAQKKKERWSKSHIIVWLLVASFSVFVQITGVGEVMDCSMVESVWNKLIRDGLLLLHQKIFSFSQIHSFKVFFFVFICICIIYKNHNHISEMLKFRKSNYYTSHQRRLSRVFVCVCESVLVREWDGLF